MECSSISSKKQRIYILASPYVVCRSLGFFFSLNRLFVFAYMGPLNYTISSVRARIGFLKTAIGTCMVAPKCL